MRLYEIDERIIAWMKVSFLPFGRIALFVVFFWFGLLKVLGYSPASGIVADLLDKTIPFMGPQAFIIALGFFEMLIGVLFLMKGMVRVVIPLLIVHMIMTFGPLVLLPSITWQGFLAPTLEGQYIIKNLVIIATALGIAAHVEPMKKS